MLKELQLTNFKSFAGDAAPIPFAPVTLLVGANASGKSNVFDAIRFLQGIGMGLSIAQILTGKWEGGQPVFLPLRGGAEEVCWAGEDAFAIRASLELDGGNTESRTSEKKTEGKAVSRSFQHKITCLAKSPSSIKSESLDIGAQGGSKIDRDSFDVEFTNSRSFLSELVEKVEVKAGERFRAGLVLVHYSNARFLDIQPSLMKNYVPLAVDELGARGENLSAMVYKICQQEEQKRQYLDWLAALCAPEVTDIEFVKTAVDDVLVQLVEGNGQKRPISARSLSDGTLRFMGYLAAMFSAPEGSLFLMEEIENGLHPTRLHLLLELLEQFAESRNLQIIATTHSSQALLSLSEETLKSAVLFARPEGTAGTITRRLGDLSNFEEVTQTTHIDRLFTTGWLEQAL